MKKIMYVEVRGGKGIKESTKGKAGVLAYEYDDEKHKNVEAKHLIMQKDGLHDARRSIDA